MVEEIGVVLTFDFTLLLQRNEIRQFVFLGLRLLDSVDFLHYLEYSFAAGNFSVEVFVFLSEGTSTSLLDLKILWKICQIALLILVLRSTISYCNSETLCSSFSWYSFFRSLDILADSLFFFMALDLSQCYTDLLLRFLLSSFDIFLIQDSDSDSSLKLQRLSESKAPSQSIFLKFWPSKFQSQSSEELLRPRNINNYWFCATRLRLKARRFN